MQERAASRVCRKPRWLQDRWVAALEPPLPPRELDELNQIALVAVIEIEANVDAHVQCAQKIPARKTMTSGFTEEFQDTPAEFQPEMSTKSTGC